MFQGLKNPQPLRAQRKVVQYFKRQISDATSSSDSSNETDSSINSCPGVSNQACTDQPTSNNNWGNYGAIGAAGKRKKFSEAKRREILKSPLRSGPKKYYKSAIIKACNLLKEGYSAETIARLFKANPKTISNWGNKYIKKNRPIELKTGVKSNYDTEVIAQACDRMKKGESMESISEDLDINIKTLKRWQAKYLTERESRLTIGVGQRFTKEIKLEICKQLIQGELTKSVAEKYGVDITCIQRWQSKYIVDGELVSNVSSIYDREIIQDACARLVKGESIKAVANAFKLHSTTVKNWSQRYIVDGKVQMNQRIFKKSVMLEACKRLGQGELAVDIAEELGCCAQSVRAWRRQYGNREKEVIRNGVKYSRKTIVEACIRLKRGESVKRVAKALGASENSVRGWRTEHLRSHKIEDGRKYSKKVVLEALDRMKRGESTSTISKDLGMSGHTLTIWRRRFIDPKTKKGACSVNIILEACEKLKEGESPEAVAAELGVDVKDVLEWELDYVTKDSSTRPTIKKAKSAKRAKLESTCNNKKHKVKKNLERSSSHRVAESKIFVPLRKIHIPKETKLQIVKMMDEGVSTARLSRELNINQLTLQSWILNRSLLLK